jgi:hypothetical protein
MVSVMEAHCRLWYKVMPYRVEWHLLKAIFRVLVIPAKAGIHNLLWWSLHWIPAFAGMTAVSGLK